MADKKKFKKREVDILESKKIESANAYIAGKDGHQVPLVVRSAYEDVKREVWRLHHLKTGMPALPGSIAKKEASKSNGAHPAVTGLSIGGMNEVIEYVFGVGFEGDTATMGFLAVPFIDGGITALIATIAAFLAKGSKK